MTEQSNISDSYHQAAVLLPFYLNGTLSEQERQEVDSHLAECQDCQNELAMMKEVHTEVKTYYAQLPQPSPNVLSRVRAQIEQEVAAEKNAALGNADNEKPTLAAKVQEFLHSVFSTQWAPVLAMSVILGQAGLLMWTLGPGSLGPHGPAVGPVIERSVPQATIHGVPSKIELAFQDQASEKEVREIIQGLNARIVDGPTRDGHYTIEVAENDPIRLEEIVKELAQHKIVRLAKKATQPNP